MMMRKVKKWKMICAAMLIGSCMLFGGCQKKENTESAEQTTETEPTENVTVAETIESAESTSDAVIALITGPEGLDSSLVDQDLWKGISDYCAKGGKAMTIAAPEDSPEGYAFAIESASDQGANIVICRGMHAANAIYTEQREEKKIRFILLSAEPTDEEAGDTYIRGNTYCIYAEPEEAGFLAGYAAVKEGFTQLGFLAGDPTQVNQLYGSGYVQGVNQAASEMGLSSGAVHVRYRILGSNSISPILKNEITDWFYGGCEVIYACGTAPEFLARRGAEAAGGKVIDTNMSEQTVDTITLASAGLNYQQAVFQALTYMEEGKFKKGSIDTLGLSDDVVGLDLSEYGWQKFDQTQYEQVVASILDGTIEVTSDDVVDDPKAHGLENVSVQIEGVEADTKQ